MVSTAPVRAPPCTPEALPPDGPRQGVGVGRCDDHPGGHTGPVGAEGNSTLHGKNGMAGRRVPRRSEEHRHDRHDRSRQHAKGGDTTTRDAAMPPNQRSECHSVSGPIFKPTSHIRATIAMHATTAPAGHRRLLRAGVTPATGTQVPAAVPSATPWTAMNPNSATVLTVADRSHRQPRRPATIAATGTQVPAAVPSATVTRARRPCRSVVLQTGGRFQTQLAFLAALRMTRRRSGPVRITSATVVIALPMSQPSDVASE